MAWMRAREARNPREKNCNKRHQIESPKRAPQEIAQGRLPHSNNGSTIEFLRSQSLLYMVTGAAHRPYGGKQPRSKRGVAAMMSAPRKRARKARPAGPLSPVKRAHGGKATSSVGLARSMDRNYKRFVMFENRARYLADPEHHGVLRGDLDGDQDLLQRRS